MNEPERKPGLKAIRLLKTAVAAWRRREELPLPPLNYFLEVTNRCNIRCRTCSRLYDPLFHDRENTGDMADGILDAVIPWFAHSLRVNTVGFGEPFLHARLLEIMESAARSGNYVVVITNGTLLETGTVEHIVRIGLNGLVVSMDGGTPEVFEHFRRGAKWNTVIQALQEIEACKQKAGARYPRVTVEFVAMKGNMATLPHLVEVIAARGVEKLHIEPLLRGGNESYGGFYAQESPGNMPLDEARAHFHEMEQRASTHSLKLVGPVVKAGIEATWNAARVLALGSLDTPPAGTPAGAVESVTGWCLHPAGVDRVVAVQSGREIASTRPDIERPDVKDAVPGEYPRKGTCGFRLEIPPGEGAIEVVAIDAGSMRTHLGRFEEAGTAPPQKTAIQPVKRKFLPYCTEPWSTMYVSFDGKVFPCCASNGDPLGDLTQEDLPAIWNGKSYRALRRAVAENRVMKMCETCVLNNRIVIQAFPGQFFPSLLMRRKKIS